MADERKKIIIIDDDADLIELLAGAFKVKGFSIHGISNGKEALVYLNEGKNLEDAALLILDRMLPDMDGIDILKQFHASAAKQIPVLILSVLSAEKDVVSGLQLGALDYVTKPFSLPVLMQKALLLMGRR